MNKDFLFKAVLDKLFEITHADSIDYTKRDLESLDVFKSVFSEVSSIVFNARQALELLDTLGYEKD